MGNGTTTNGISSATLSKLATFVFAIVLSGTTTWTILQLRLYALQRDSEDHERRITTIEKKQQQDLSDQMEQLKKANAQLEEILRQRQIEKK